MEYHQELQALADELHLTHSSFFHDRIPIQNKPKFDSSATVLFIPSFSEAQRQYLLSESTCLLYTPENEHFGIVPLEAMVSGLPVLAIRSGGPMESIVHQKTGMLLESDPVVFSAALYRLLFQMTDTERNEMGKAGRERVESQFSLTAFSAALKRMVDDLGQQAIPPPTTMIWAISALVVFSTLVVSYLAI